MTLASSRFIINLFAAKETANEKPHKHEALPCSRGAQPSPIHLFELTFVKISYTTHDLRRHYSERAATAHRIKVDAVAFLACQGLV